jgi:ATP-dependent DNA helicase RecQ
MENEEFNGTEVARFIFSCVYQINQKFGVSHIANVLVGSRAQKVLKYNHQNLANYGALKEYSLEQVKQFINELIEKEYLWRTRSEYPVVRLLDKANFVQAGAEQVMLKKVAKVLPKGESVNRSVELFRNGKSITEISQERGLAPTTVANHLITELLREQIV